MRLPCNFHLRFVGLKINPYLCTRIPPSDARMAESVDATVSNTVGATHPGSSPGPGTKLRQKPRLLTGSVAQLNRAAAF